MKKLFFYYLLFFTNVSFAQLHDHAVTSALSDTSYTEVKIQSIMNKTHSHYDMGFNLLANHAQQFNKIMDRPWYIEHYLLDIILQETAPKVNGFDDDNWNFLVTLLKRDYQSNLVNMAFELSKIRYYKVREDWPRYANGISNFLQKCQNYFSDMEINNAVYNLFQKCDDQQVLSQGADWMVPVVITKNSRFDAYIDTYASVLYKCGKIKEAIEWEKKALSITPYDQDFKSKLAQMEKGEKIH